jgi:pimeloyl-ACP methyl ester carboxylesterase
MPQSRHVSSLLCATAHFSAEQVYAIDLLGFGESEKAILDYKIELWRDQVHDFVATFCQTPATVIGNSIGSLVTLSAAHQAGQGAIKAIVLLNCAGGALLKPLAALH